MRESCYCGRVGEVEDRHLDPLPCLDADARREMFEEAERRSLERLFDGARAGHGRDRAAW